MSQNLFCNLEHVPESAHQRERRIASKITKRDTYRSTCRGYRIQPLCSFPILNTHARSLPLNGQIPPCFDRILSSLVESPDRLEKVEKSSELRQSTLLSQGLTIRESSARQSLSPPLSLSGPRPEHLLPAIASFCVSLNRQIAKERD